MANKKHIPTILDILKEGGSIEFPSGYKLQGDPETNYIEMIFPFGGKDGLCILNEEGLKEAIQYAKDFETHIKEQENGEKMKNKLIIFMGGGIIQDTVSDTELDITIIDNDVDGIPIDELVVFEDYQNDNFKATVDGNYPIVDKDEVNFYINQIECFKEPDKEFTFPEMDAIIEKVAIKPILDNMLSKENKDLSFSTPASFFREEFYNAIGKKYHIIPERVVELFNKRYRTLVTIKRNQFLKLYPNFDKPF